MRHLYFRIAQIDTPSIFIGNINGDAKPPLLIAEFVTVEKCFQTSAQICLDLGADQGANGESNKISADWWPVIADDCDRVTCNAGGGIAGSMIPLAHRQTLFRWRGERRKDEANSPR